MIRRTLLIILCSTLFGSALISAQNKQEKQEEPAIIVEVEAAETNMRFDGQLGEMYWTTPIVEMRGATPSAPPSYGKCIADPQALREFEKRLNRETYAVYFGGAFVKTATRDTGWRPIWGADIKTQGLPVNSNNQGLASPMKLGHKQSLRRPASKEVQKEFESVAQQVLAHELKVAPNQVGKITSDWVFEIEVEANVKSVVGRAMITGDRETPTVFMIAERENGVLVPVLSQLNRDRRQALRFVDQLDLDRDGVDEVVTRKADNRLGYRIFRRNKGEWALFYADDRNGDCVRQVYPPMK